MAYNEATPFGSNGAYNYQFRVFVNTVRTYNGTAAEGYEYWKAEGGVNRVVSGPVISKSGLVAHYRLEMDYYENASYFNYSYSSPTGQKTYIVLGPYQFYRDPDGSPYSFLAAMTVLFQNYDYLGTALVQITTVTDDKPRQANITATSGNIYETDSPSVTFTNPASLPVNVWLELPDLDFVQYAQRTSVASPYTWTLTTPERDAIRTAMANTNQTTLRYFVATQTTPFPVYSTSDSTITIDNRAGIASPTFTTWGVTDTHAGALGVTSGGNPVMVQGKSVARATITVANKGVAIKQATMSSYSVSIGPYSGTVAYSSGSDVTKDVTFATDAPTLEAGSQNMTVSAVDSRTNSTPVTKSILVLPYANPSFFPTISLDYVNRFDIADGLDVSLSGGDGLVTIAPLHFSGTDYNDLDPGDIQFKLYKGSLAGSSSAWEDVTFTQTPDSGIITASEATLASAIEAEMNTLVADNEENWYVVFRITDKYNTNLESSPVLLDIGAPIFRIGVDGKVYNQEKVLLPAEILYPVGCIYTSTASTNPATLFGFGTWTAFGAGKVLVGLDSGDGDFDTAEETGGAKTVTLTSGQIPAHSHPSTASPGFVVGTNAGGSATIPGAGQPNGPVNWAANTGNNTGGGGSHTNVQPYIVVYHFKRTA